MGMVTGMDGTAIAGTITAGIAAVAIGGTGTEAGRKRSSLFHTAAPTPSQRRRLAQNILPPA